MTWSIAFALSIFAAVAPDAAPDAGASGWHLPAGDRDLSWRQAAKRCERLDAEGHGDWRLPTEAELAELASRAEDGDAGARDVIAGLGGAAAWSRDASPSGLAWAAAFEHGYLLRLHAANEVGLRALCVRGTAPAAPAEDVDRGSWLRPLDLDSESPLLWPCTGDERQPVRLRGSIASFRRGLPPGPLREAVPVDFVVDEEGRARFAGPAPGTPERLGRLAVETLETFRFEPATCDGVAVPVFYHLDFGGG